ncbi:MAG: hypothetical protein IT210_07645 [Armatimonadetes bacterium]|nr:hypothetical protein [Armatimonadota bacterium]
MLDRVGSAANTALYRKAAQAIRGAIIEERGWLGDHYATLLDASAGNAEDPWTGEVITGEMPGWDAARIYTVNGLALLEMVGRSVGIDEEKIRIDLRGAADRCLRYYGCVHSDCDPGEVSASVKEGLAGSALQPSCIVR